jgi:hypothetical protein
MIRPCSRSFNFALPLYDNETDGVLLISMPNIHLGQMCISFRMNEIP